MVQGAIARPGLWKILLGIGIGIALIAFILGWIGFGVPDWHQYQLYSGATLEYYGLWAYCQEQSPYFNTVCKRWSTAADQLFNGSRPNFIGASEGLITPGMIFLSLGLIAAVFAAILPLLGYVAGVLTFLAFLLIVIGVPIFGRESNNLSSLRGDVTYSKRYGFGLMIATIVLAFIAAILFLVAAYLYQRFGFGNFATSSYTKNPYGGQQMLGPAYALGGMPYGARPGMMNPYQYQPVGYPGPSLLSQYIAQRMPRYSGAIQRPVVSVLRQPSIVVSGATPAYVTPNYYRSAAPIINLTGRTLYGPIVRTT